MAKKTQQVTISTPPQRPAAPKPPRAGFRKDGRRLSKGGKLKK